MYKYLYCNCMCSDFVDLERIGFITYSNVKKFCDFSNLAVSLDDFGNLYIEPKGDLYTLKAEYVKLCTILKGGRYEKKKNS